MDEMSDHSQYLEYIGVYNADASIWGEVSYWFGARFGIRHCSLCDVTHGLFRERADWVFLFRRIIATMHRKMYALLQTATTPSFLVALQQASTLFSTMHK